MPSSPTIEERIAQIQLNAFANLGMSAPEIADHFHRKRLEIEAFAAARPTYLGDNIPKTPDWDHYIERNLAARFDRPTPTPYQEPFVHAWLTDVWLYHKARLYADETPADQELVLATAPTGRFNAIALPDRTKNGILIEDGLLNFAREFIKLISALLYYRDDAGYRIVEPGDQLANRISVHQTVIEGLLDTTVMYLVEGYVPTPAPSDTDLDFSSHGDIHDAIFHGFVVFVLEHELHHLIAKPQGRHLTEGIAEQFDELWLLFEKHVIPDISTPLDQAEVRQLFEDHQEEILADFRAMNRLFALGRIDQLIWPLLDGGLLFFHVAEVLRWSQLKIADPQRLELEAKVDGRWLSISAIMHQESHPYPLVRKSGVLARTRAAHAPYAELLIEREKRFIQVFNSIRAAFNRRYATEAVPTRLAPKWTSDEKALLAAL